MDLLNIANRSHNNSFQQDVLNNSTAQVVDSSTRVYIFNFLLFILCQIGLPGNVLVIAVYVDNMSTSTRVYLFALAVVDLVVCVCGIILIGVKIGQVLMDAVDVAKEISLIFSVFLLAFVATERLMAVRRPHTFSLCAVRAKRALAVISAAACVTVTVHQILKRYRSVILIKLFEISIFLSSLLTMSICYSLVTITLIKKAWSARTKVERQSDESREDPKPSVKSTALSVSENKAGVVSGSHGTVHVSSTNPVGRQQVNQCKGLSALPVVTAVFIACFHPNLLSTSKEIQHFILLNSVLNPFIYSFMCRMFRNDTRQFFRKLRSKVTLC